MPDIIDTTLGLSLHGFFKHWYGHSLLGAVTLDLAGGLFLTWILAVLVGRLSQSANAPYYVRAFLPKASANRLSLWSFSVLVGILSHLGFDLISHDTNMLFYPWYENPHLFPEWWYSIWFRLPALSAFGRTYGVGVFTIFWSILTGLGIFLFIQFIRQTENQKTELGRNTMPSDEDHLGEFDEI